MLPPFGSRGKQQDSDTKGTNHTLHYDKYCLSAAIEITNKAEQKRSEQTINGISFEMAMGVDKHISFTCENGREQISVK